MFRRAGRALIALVLVVGVTGSVRAQRCPGPGAPDTLVSYRFVGAGGSEATGAPTYQRVTTTSPPMRRGSGLTPAAAAQAFGASQWASSGNALDTADYFSFRLQSYVGSAYRIASIGLRGQRSRTGPRRVEIRSSADRFASSLFAATVPDNDLVRRWNVGLGPKEPFDSLLTDVEFRIYGYDAEAAAGTWLVDNVYLVGFTVNTGAIRPAIQFTNATQTVAESAPTLRIPVYVTDAILDTMSVRVELVPAPGTATAGTDFTFTPQTLTFTSGGGPESVSLQMVTLRILDDALPETDETVQLQLTNASTGTLLGNPSIITVTIAANDEGTASPTLLEPIAAARPLNPQGIPARSGQRVRLRGVVAAPNLRAPGYETTLIDRSGGIGLLRTAALGTQAMNSGDSLEVVGIITQHNGLTQVAVDSFRTLRTGQLLPAAPRVVTVLDETTESALVRLAKPVHLISPLQWTNASSGFVVDVADSTTTYALRVVRGTDVFNSPAPTGSFTLTGIGGQADPAAPYATGYQLTPRSLADIRPVVPANNPTIAGLMLYPNPTTDVLNLRATGPSALAVITVLDLRGQVVVRAPAGTTSLRVGFLPAGVYAVRVGTQARRFAKY